MHTRKSVVRTILAAVALLGGSSLSGQEHPHEDRPAGSATHGVPLFDDLGNHAFKITTRPDAQAYFNQGLRLYYAFNHSEAIRSFREAQRRDPECAMCWWGEALAWGPNINLPLDADGAAAAFAALEESVARIEGASPIEQALIRALTVRYEPDPGADRSPLDRAYADAMASVVEQFPSDPEAAVLYAEAVMTTMPWDYWDEEARPRVGISEALGLLEAVMIERPDHPGACHFYIHAVEKHYPGRAVACAERLAALMPGAGHLVHMPGHIYIRVGRYLEAIEANEHAVHADETYIQDQRPGVGVYTAGYYPHNYDFLAFAASMIGRSQQGIEAATRVHEVIPPEMLGAPGLVFLQHYSTRRLQLLVRFGRWDDILATRAPDAELLHGQAMWHYARGRARAATGDPTAAREELALVSAALHSPKLTGVRLEPNLVTDVLAVAEKVLAGWVAVAEDRLDDAIAELTGGAELEDRLLYGEPPEWTIPVRHDLGAVLLMADRPHDAERTYREDLERFPGNGWSLFGLSQALSAQGRSTEAAEARTAFREAWAASDVQIDASVF